MKCDMIFKSKKNFHKSNFSCRRIGVMGLGPRSGTTHIAVAICNYLSDTEKKRVALIEQSRHDDIGRLIMSLGAEEDAEAYTFHRVTYVPYSTVKQTGGLTELNSDCMVFDFGCDVKNCMSSMLLCDIRILVGTDAPWRAKEYEKIGELLPSNGSRADWRLFVNLGNACNLKEKDRYFITSGCFPFEPDPVYPGGETTKFIREMIYV